ncbi:hypothetical protein BJX63DRAFT_359414 [Aspergillus granulosus]|uniref:Uncharacterized protein n=1 Tax=Aspergillus granulosus TaxID=176169 RepID=A0ABR4HWD8_9EURO
MRKPGLTCAAHSSLAFPSPQLYGGFPVPMCATHRMLDIEHQADQDIVRTKRRGEKQNGGIPQTSLSSIPKGPPLIVGISNTNFRRSQRALEPFGLQELTSQALGIPSPTPIAQLHPSDFLILDSRCCWTFGNWHVNGCLGSFGGSRQLQKLRTATCMWGSCVRWSSSFLLGPSHSITCLRENPITVLSHCSYLRKEIVHHCIRTRRQTEKSSFPNPWRRWGRHFCCCEKHPTCRKLKTSHGSLR